MKNLFRISAALALCIAIFSSTAFARGNGHGNGRVARAQYAEWDHDRDRDDWPAHHRNRADIGVYSGVFGARPANRPPGWDRGRKTGWGNCDLPPGQAKRYGCRGTLFGRQHRGTVIVFERRSSARHRNSWHPHRRDRDRD